MRTNKLNVIRYLTVTSVLLLLIMFVTGCSEEAAPTADSSIENPTGELSKNNVIHHVSVGGADVCEALGLPTGCDANFSLVAKMKADGSVSGQWQDSFGDGEGIHVAVDCMNVVGNGAVIGGVITHGTVGGVDFSGQRAITAVVDNGTSVNDPADQISFSFFPAADCSALTPGDFPLNNLTHGQVKVR